MRKSIVENSGDQIRMCRGGIMLERVLKRLCPCYFARSDDSEMSADPASDQKDSDLRETSRYNDKSECRSVFDHWKGSLSIVQPQPIYAFPVDAKKPIKRNRKTLLKPPLYWKKTMKNLCSDGPPVFQQLENGGRKVSDKENNKKEGSKEVHHKKAKFSEKGRCTTFPPSATTIDLKWFKSQSLSNLTAFGRTFDHKKAPDFSLSNPSDGCTTQNSLKYDFVKQDWNCFKCQILPDISHGVILFTAAYFRKKKLCMININRLENLSKKGREGNSYYTVVKLAILPTEKYIRCSKVLSNCSCPEVKQDFSFSLREVTGKVLRLSVFDASLQKQHEAVGHALLTLEDVISDQPKKYRIKLYQRTQPHVCPGSLALSMKYLFDEDKFTVIVERGRNLCLQRDKNVKLNTYVKATLYAYGEKVKTKKSIVVFNCRDPNYNSTFTFLIRNDQIDHLSVSLAVRLKGFVNDLTIGRLNFGPFFYGMDQKLTPWGKVFLNGETVSHWYRMYL